MRLVKKRPYSRGIGLFNQILPVKQTFLTYLYLQRMHLNRQSKLTSRRGQIRQRPHSLWYNLYKGCQDNTQKYLVRSSQQCPHKNTNGKKLDRKIINKKVSLSMESISNKKKPRNMKKTIVKVTSRMLVTDTIKRVVARVERLCRGKR